jgi:hypothetical protein
VFPGPVGKELWYVGLDGILWPGLAIIFLLCGIVRSIRRRPFVTRWRVMGFLLLLMISAVPWFINLLPFFFVPYPSSHRHQLSSVAYRIPLDGPVTVLWGGGLPGNNYHAVYPDQCWAFDLGVSQQEKTFRGEGTQLEDYYCFGLPVLAPSDGKVVSVVDGNPNMPVGQLGGEPAGGNQIVIEVKPREFLFLCHLQPGSITVQPGEQVVAGQRLGYVGNSGNTSEPHLHIHLQDSPADGDGEGIPLPFHHYRSGDKIVPRGIPLGGLAGWEIIEHIPSNTDIP